MKKLLKREDGSKSQRGLWDNIRAKKERGEKPAQKMSEGRPSPKAWRRVLAESMAKNET